MDETKLSVAEEFKILFQPLSLEGQKELEKEIVNAHVPQTVCVWHDTLIEAPEKYRICKRLDIPFKRKELFFGDNLEVGAYICISELERKDLTVEMKTYLIGRLFLYRQEIAARDFVNRSPNVIMYPKRGNRPKGMSETAKEIANELSLVSGTILKYGRYASAIETIRRLDPTIAKAILSHQIKISHEDLQELVCNENRLVIFRKLSKEVKSAKVIYCEFKKNRMEEDSNIQKRMNENKPHRKITPSIHEMPKYDPDADILNLIYTIPSWISSIDRARNNTDFRRTTKKSNLKLANQLSYLLEAVERIEASLKEVM